MWNLKKVIVKLYVLIIWTCTLAKFQENQRLMIMLSITCLNFCGKKLCIKNKLIDRIVNNTKFEWNLTCVLRVCLDRTYFAETENLLLKSL